jgi:hypothetical protein
MLKTEASCAHAASSQEMEDTNTSTKIGTEIFDLKGEKT